MITFVDRPDSPEVLGVEVSVGEELRGGDAGVVDPGQLPADPELHAVGVVDPDNLGGRGQGERDLKTVSLEQHLYKKRS